MQYSLITAQISRQNYSPTDVFMSFEFYHVEERGRVKCVSALEGMCATVQY